MSQAYQFNLTCDWILQCSAIYSIVDDENVIRNQWESGSNETLEALRWRSDRRRECPQPIVHASFPDIGIIEE